MAVRRLKTAGVRLRPSLLSLLPPLLRLRGILLDPFRSPPGARLYAHMKSAVIIAVLLLVLLVLVVMLHQTRSADFKWDYDYVRDPPCTNTRTKSCVKGFKVFVGDPGSHPKEVFVSNRLDDHEQLISNRIGTTLTFETYGHVQFCVISVGADASGTAVESKPTCLLKFVVPLVTKGVRLSGEH